MTKMKKILNVIEFDFKHVKNVYYLFFEILLFILLFNSCDVCDTQEIVEEDKPGEIIYSSVAVNDSLPSIYTISKDGRKIRLLEHSAILYSSISNNSQMVYFRVNTNKEYANLLLKDLKAETVLDLIPRYLFFNNMHDPVLSPEGYEIALPIGNNNLYWILNIYQKGFLVTQKFYENSLPTFSNDGEKLIFYEGKEDNQPIKITMMQMLIPYPDVVNTVTYPNGIKPYKGKATIQYTNSNKLVFVITNADNNDAIIIRDWQNNIDKEYPVPIIGAYMPTISPDETFMAFVGRDGNLYLKNLFWNPNDNIILSESNSDEYILYPQWSIDGKLILYTRFYQDDNRECSGRLELVNVETKAITILSNNVFRGFWYNNQ